MQIVFWDWRNRKEMARLEESHTDDVIQVCVFDDVIQVKFAPGHQNQLISSSVDGLMCIFNTDGDINDDDHLESVMNVGTSIGKFGFFGDLNKKLWCLTHIETLSIWDWKDGRNEINFQEARTLASDSWNLDHNNARIFQLGNDVSQLKQGDLSLLTYNAKLRAVWEEMDHYQSATKWDTVADSEKYAKLIEKNRIFQFLQGLNSEFEFARVQLLGHYTLSSLDELYSFMLFDESRRTSLPALVSMSDRSAMVVQIPCTTSTPVSQSSQPDRWNFSQSQPRRRDLRCEHCGRWGHVHQLVDHFVDCNYSGADDRLWVIGGTNTGILGYFPVDYSGVSGRIGSPDAILKNGHTGIVRSVLPSSHISGGNSGIFAWTGGEDGRLCCWLSEKSSEIHSSWISSALVMKTLLPHRKIRHHPY
ncbi:hypothetical protein GIB67_019302 [Kingdonia uniflora]|uniref:Uncharacterized protein n=1 Tax=Kingdonia uniflora TaxID=39325 RepID=A0A7J7L1G8_9MAGN|nr:hypothetical protein GIB67_019302 [Kingdonia uniflora]